jgi:hypothetical protein
MDRHLSPENRTFGSGDDDFLGFGAWLAYSFADLETCTPQDLGTASCNETLGCRSDLGHEHASQTRSRLATQR